jgi:hypothetical protein
VGSNRRSRNVLHRCFVLHILAGCGDGQRYPQHVASWTDAMNSISAMSQMPDANARPLS